MRPQTMTPDDASMHPWRVYCSRTEGVKEDSMVEKDTKD